MEKRIEVGQTKQVVIFKGRDRFRVTVATKAAYGLVTKGKTGWDVRVQLPNEWLALYEGTWPTPVKGLAKAVRVITEEYQ